MPTRPAPLRRVARAAALAALTAAPLAAQSETGAPAPQVVRMDSARIAALYVSNRHEDHPPADYARQMAQKRRTDSVYAARSANVMEFRKITYRSRVDGMTIPAYLFAPLQKRGAKGHAAMIWVHGGVHGDWGTSMFPFVREAVQRGYVIITPDYRGSTGHGEAHHKAIDYGGKEVDDVISAVDFLKTLPYVDQDRLGMMGWSHGGFITAHTLFRDAHEFKAGAAIVPVTNLITRLSYRGPGYARSFSTQKELQGLPHEQLEEYVRRSPVYHAEKLKVPMLVHVATNDRDVYYIEDVQMVHTLRSLKPDLAETKIYVDPAPWGSSVGHAFSRRVDPVTLERVDSPEQIDSWNRTWTFFDWTLRPYEDRSKPAPPVRTR
ncbi:alpha/beta hydrolase family protein [Roseisolibacter agri]|uniref:alpha/beta hydrolase family protein n=1 Tax=Roseisolibacter agri TaxID=2014610 RepID=UPI0024E18D89|nr:alpha/beta fold hydrolase [Roseisolibacter agri]